MSHDRRRPPDRTRRQRLAGELGGVEHLRLPSSIAAQAASTASWVILPLATRLAEKQPAILVLLSGSHRACIHQGSVALSRENLSNAAAMVPAPKIATFM